MERDGKVGVHLDGSIGCGVSRLELIEGLTGRRLRTKAERARIAAESLAPGAKVADVARRHGTTRWQVYDWRRKLFAGQLTVPEGVVGLPVFAELMVDDTAMETRPAQTASDLEIVVGDVVIRASASADEGLLARAIRAARASQS